VGRVEGPTPLEPGDLLVGTGAARRPALPVIADRRHALGAQLVLAFEGDELALCLAEPGPLRARVALDGGKVGLEPGQILKPGEVEQASGGRVRQLIELQRERTWQPIEALELAETTIEWSFFIADAISPGESALTSPSRKRSCEGWNAVAMTPVSREPEAARAMISFMISPEAAPLVRKTYVEPVAH
jgi:hypothetical protein